MFRVPVLHSSSSSSLFDRLRLGLRLVRDDGGYILAQTALLIIPLFVFAAFATDIGFWYVQGQKAQRAADAAATAAVLVLPDSDAAVVEAKAVAARNGFTDATPNDNTDFETGPLPQIKVTIARPGAVEVRIRNEEESFLGKVVTDGIVVERFALAEFASDIHLGNPTSGLGTGTIPAADLGMPGDGTWLALNAYCLDKKHGDHFGSGYRVGVGTYAWTLCGPNPGQVSAQAKPNPTFDPDAYVFVVEAQPGSPPVTISIFEPGAGCSGSIATGDNANAPRIHYRIYGPSTSLAHRAFVDTSSPIAEGLLADNACIANSPNGDGWWPLLSNAPVGIDGGFYYVQLNARNPASPDLDPGDPYWAETYVNSFSLKATRNATTELCSFSNADPTCPNLYALEWLPLYRDLPNDETEFFLTEVPDYHRGGTMFIRMFDAAEGVDNIQIAGPDGTAVPFEWRYADTSLNLMTEAGYWETAFQPHNRTCSWNGVGGNPCLDTRNSSNFNDHMVEVRIEIPATYSCGGSCWWTARYNTATAPTDRTNWSVEMRGDPVRLVE